MGMATQTAYCASKFALRGFAEGMDYELRSDNIYVSMAYPPDVDTDQHAHEKTLLHPAIAEIQSEGGLFQPDEVGSTICTALERGDRTVVWGMDGWMLNNLCYGMGQPSSLADTFSQV